MRAGPRLTVSMIINPGFLDSSLLTCMNLKPQDTWVYARLQMVLSQAMCHCLMGNGLDIPFECATNTPNKNSVLNLIANDTHNETLHPSSGARKPTEKQHKDTVHENSIQL
ncbi:UNVERIFIED_CONTAM: hypothetical protein K2H54_045641, partial [Gekko kuhli]